MEVDEHKVEVDQIWENIVTRNRVKVTNVILRDQTDVRYRYLIMWLPLYAVISPTTKRSTWQRWFVRKYRLVQQ